VGKDEKVAMGLWGDELSIENTGFYMFVVGSSLSNCAREDTLGDLIRRMGVSLPNGSA
jgi:hypothetical protein